MDTATLIKNLEKPKGRVDVILDTDAGCEVDDQFAISYLLSYNDKVNIKALYAAPFTQWDGVTGPAEGVEKSFKEIHKVLDIIDRADMRPPVYKGSDQFMKDADTPVVSDAARHFCELAMDYTSENPLYIIGIGACTNIASAILMKPQIMDRIVVIWQGGNALHWPKHKDYNMYEDIVAAKVLFGCGVPLVHFPAMGVVSSLSISGAEFERFLLGKNRICDYLAQNVIQEEERKRPGQSWTRVIWDIAAVSWLIGDFSDSYLIASPIPEYGRPYGNDPRRHLIRYVYAINRDGIVTDMFTRLSALQL